MYWSSGHGCKEMVEHVRCVLTSFFGSQNQKIFRFGVSKASVPTLFVCVVVAATDIQDDSLIFQVFDTEIGELVFVPV